MTQEALKTLTDDMISQVIAWGQVELAARTEQRVGVTVAIERMRGRRPTPSRGHVTKRVG
jgi:hypothetical protein